MALCASGLLLSALVLIVILNDVLSDRIHYIPDHLFLGVVTCTLFFTFCNYGLEQINWAFLALIPVIFFIKWIYTPPPSFCSDDYDECQACRIPKKKCSCPVKKPEFKPPALNCPGNPVVLPTACGITRYS